MRATVAEEELVHGMVEELVHGRVGEPGARRASGAVVGPAHEATSPQRWLLASGALVLSLLPLVACLGNGIAGVDPAEYAEIGRELFANHRWLPLRNDDSIYLDKPPLTFWVLRCAFSLLGPTPLAARVPALLGIAAAIGALAWLGWQLWRDERGLWAAALLLSTPLVQLGVADPKIDVFLLGPLTLSTACFVAARERRPFLLPAWGFAALGLLTKGPVGLLLPPAAAIASSLRDARWGPGWIRRILAHQPVAGIAAALALALPFYRSVAADSGRSGVKFLLWDQSFGRLFERSASNGTGPLFFAHTLLWAAAPFTIALLVALWRAARRTLARRRVELPLAWFALGFLVVSASSYKLPHYLIWGLPGGALLTAGMLAPGRCPRGMAALLAATSLLELGVVAAASAWAFSLPSWALLLMLLGLGAAVALWRFDPLRERSRLLPILGASLSGLVLTACFHPALQAHDPGAALGRAAAQSGVEGEILCLDGEPLRAVAFYAGRITRSASLERVRELAGRAPLLVEARVADEPAFAAAGLEAKRLAETDAFRVSMPTRRFLDPATRAQVVTPLGLYRVQLRPAY